MASKMLYLAAASLAAAAIATKPKKLHGFDVHTTIITLESDSDKDVEAYNDALEAHYEAGWADTPTNAWEGVSEEDELEKAKSEKVAADKELKAAADAVKAAKTKAKKAKKTKSE